MRFNAAWAGRAHTSRYQLIDPVIMPDIAVMAKPISCGLPLGAILCNERAAKSIGSGMHGSTFGGNVIACRVAIEFFDILDELMPSIRETGAYFRMRLDELGAEVQLHQRSPRGRIDDRCRTDQARASRSCSIAWSRDY